MIEAILKRGTLVTVVMVMLMLLGIVAAVRAPVQMIPDLDVRTITIQTRWPGATPQDVEKEIVIEQEQYLRGLPNLTRMTSPGRDGRGQHRAGVSVRRRCQRGADPREQRAEPGAGLPRERR